MMTDPSEVKPVRPCIDFHFHSYYSNDAFGDPAEYVRLAESRGVVAIAPTEHDNVDSWIHYRKAIEEQKVKLPLYTGVEIDVSNDRFGHLHILGFFFDRHHPRLKSILDVEIQSGMVHLQKVVARMNEEKHDIDLDRAFAHFRADVPGRAVGPKAVWTWLAHTGKAASFDDAKDLYQKYSKQIPNPHRSGDMKVAIDTVHDAGGIVLLAHPAHHRIFQEEDVEEMYRMGIDAVDIYHGKSTREGVMKWVNITERRGWVRSGGSDNHEALTADWNKWPTRAPADLLEPLFRAHEKLHGKQPAEVFL